MNSAEMDLYIITSKSIPNGFASTVMAAGRELRANPTQPYPAKAAGPQWMRGQAVKRDASWLCPSTARLCWWIPTV